MEQSQEAISGLYIVQFENGFVINHTNDVHKVVTKLKYPWVRPILDCYYISMPNAKDLVMALKKEFKFGLFLYDGDITEVIKFSLLYCKEDKRLRHCRLRKLDTRTMTSGDVSVKDGKIYTPVTTKAELMEEILKKYPEVPE